MSRWFRVYDDLVDDPKVQRLSPATFKHLINIWCIASSSGGTLPADDQISFKLRLTIQKTNKLLSELKAYDLLEDDGLGGLQPHNWNGRQYKTDVSTPRVRAFRERQAKLNGGVS